MFPPYSAIATARAKTAQSTAGKSRMYVLMIRSVLVSSLRHSQKARIDSATLIPSHKSNEIEGRTRKCDVLARPRRHFWVWHDIFCHTLLARGEISEAKTMPISSRPQVKLVPWSRALYRTPHPVPQRVPHTAHRTPQQIHYLLPALTLQRLTCSAGRRAGAAFVTTRFRPAGPPPTTPRIYKLRE